MQTTVSIPGMHCASCAALVKDVTSAFPEIRHIEVDLETRRVTMEHDDAFTIEHWKDEVQGLGEEYTVYPVASNA
ncbi:MAG: heavy-metal-associated domain-containing protein [Candidatus Peribacteraceae bacterium]|jgi:copper chaperone CopZ